MGWIVLIILAFEAVEYLVKEMDLKLTKEEGLHNYIKAVEKGLLKILQNGDIYFAKLSGAQIFEAIGLNHEFIEDYFTGTVSRIEGAVSILSRGIRLKAFSGF